MAASASSPFGETVKYDPTSPRSRACASTTTASIPAFWKAIAVAGPATPAPMTSARIVLSFLYDFRIFRDIGRFDIRRIFAWHGAVKR